MIEVFLMGTEKMKKSVKVIKKAGEESGCHMLTLCGGCMGQTESYETSLKEKHKKIEKVLGEYGKAEPIIGMSDPYHYRKRVQKVFGHDRSGTPLCGIREPETGKVIQIEKCNLDDEKASEIILSVRDLLKSFKIKTYDEKSGYGLLRNVLVRKAMHTDEIMVVLVLSSSIMPSKNNFVKALRKIHPEITTMIVNENYKISKTILGDKENNLYGKGFIIDKLCGKEFRVSSKSFYPNNTAQAEVLYEKVVSYAELTGTERILDAYCGIGTIGIVASEKAKKVLSVDNNPHAIRDAISNTKRNQIKNIDFYTQDAAEFVNQVSESDKEPIDVVFMDPPQAGSDNAFIEALGELKPKKIIYLSHSLSTLAADLKKLERKGYQVKRMVGVDMSPWTVHVETAVLLVRKD